MEKIALVVLAAGIGSRYGGLKQILPVGPSGETIIDYSLFDALRAGFGKFVFIIRKDIEEDFRQVIGKYWEKKVETEYVFQELDSSLPKFFSLPAARQKPWGTAHALLVCRDVLDVPFTAINADDFYGLGSFQAIAGYLKNLVSNATKPDTYCFVGYLLRNTLSDYGSVSRGVCSLDENGCLRGIVEMLKIEKDGVRARAMGMDGGWLPLTGDEIASMNFWGFTPSIFTLLEKGFADFLQRRGQDLKAEYLIPTAVHEFIKLGVARIKNLPTEEKWFGVTYPEDVPSVIGNISEKVKDGVYPKRLKS